ncbi:MAG: aldose 1-epimerase family protein [Acidobacteriota bacterium]
MEVREHKQQETFHQTLTSVKQGIRLRDWAIESDSVTPDCPVRWNIRKTTLHGGKQEGVDRIVLDNGVLQIQVIPTRGMGILDVRKGDWRLGWDSPIRDVVHPAFVNLHSRGGLGWLEGFNEWMVRCGLEWAGQPGRDRFVNNMGDEAEMDLTLHGKIANIPASEVEIEVQRTPPYSLRVRGRVDERMFHGPKLELWSEIAVDPGATEFTLHDRLTNRGGGEQEFQLIYHTNFGPPLLGVGSRFTGAVGRVFPLNARAAEDLDRFAEYEGPTAGFIEQVYCLTPLADERGRTAMVLHNRGADRGLLLRYAVEELPCLTLWKNSVRLEDGYVTGLEPGTGFPYPRRIERSFGRVPRLAAGETRDFTLRYRVLEGAADVAAALRAVETIQAGRTLEVVPTPPELS